MKKTPVLLMVECHGKRRARLVSIRTLPRVDRPSVDEVVAEAIQPGHAVRTDGLPVYDELTTPMTDRLCRLRKRLKRSLGSIA